MAPIFASPDIAALVAAFPPPLPMKEQPSLVRSLSGNNLHNSQKVLARLRALLQTSPNRIKCAELPSRLGVERTDWIFECYDEPINFVADRQAIVPVHEFNNILRNLRKKLTEEFVKLSSFAREVNVALDSFRDLAKLEGFEGNRSFLDSGGYGTEVVGSQHLVERTKEQIKDALLGEHTEECYMTRLLPTIPSFVLADLAREVVESDSSIDGTISLKGNDSRFIPSGLEQLKERHKLQAYESSLRDCVLSLESDGLAEVPWNCDCNEIIRRWQKQHESSDASLPTVLGVHSASKIIVLQNVLDETLGQLRSNVTTIAAQVRQTGGKIEHDLKLKLIESSPQPTLAKAILDSVEYTRDVDAALIAAISDLDEVEQNRFADLFQTTAMAPVELYATGIGTVQDPTLKQHLEEYIGEHFRRETIATFLDTARNENLLANDKARNRDAEKLSQSCTQAKTLEEVRSVVIKFAKKQKVDPPTPSTLTQIRHQILRQKAALIRKMSRGSDVLQNLIWILLAQGSEGLFMSSGRDTSRMIKQCRLIGKESTAKKLEQWRDLLKTGSENGMDVEEMRDMAGKVVEEIVGVGES